MLDQPLQVHADLLRLRLRPYHRARAQSCAVTEPARSRDGFQQGGPGGHHVTSRLEHTAEDVHFSAIAWHEQLIPVLQHDVGAAPGVLIQLG